MPVTRHLARGLLALAVASLAGCAWMPSFLGGGNDALKPAELQPNPNLQPVRQAWTARLGRVDFPLAVQAAAGQVLVAAGDGTVAVSETRIPGLSRHVTVAASHSGQPAMAVSMPEA